MIHVGISGKIAAGKSTLAKSLKQLAIESGYACEIIPFVFAVREVAALEEYNDIERRARITNLFYSWGYDYHLSLQAAALTDDYMQKYPTIPGQKNRKLLQAIGTEVGRNLICKEIWIYRVQHACRNLGAIDFLISDDVRFNNEALAVDVHIGVDVQATYEGYREWNILIGQLGKEYAFSEHSSETSLTVQPMYVLPHKFTQQHVLSVFEELDKIRKLRIC